MTVPTATLASASAALDAGRNDEAAQIFHQILAEDASEFSLSLSILCHFTASDALATHRE